VHMIWDLWEELRKRGRGMKVGVERAEEEVDEDEEQWLKKMERY